MVPSPKQTPADYYGARCTDHESNKVAMVPDPNTVVDPWTVMVHSVHTLFTLSTMMSLRKSELLALLTPKSETKLVFPLFHVCLVFALLG